jgi:hypothetical protein
LFFQFSNFRLSNFSVFDEDRKDDELTGTAEWDVHKAEWTDDFAACTLPLTGGKCKGDSTITFEVKRSLQNLHKYEAHLNETGEMATPN